MHPCPPTPNCVSSLSPETDVEHHITSLQLPRPESWDQLHDAIVGLPRTHAITVRPDYRHYTFTTAWMRFTDDLELRLEPDGRTVHIRSASRVGRSDLGVNRRRVETLRHLLNTAP